MLAGLLAQRRLGLFGRWAARAQRRLDQWNAYWASLSRRGRRAFRRKMAPAAVGVAMLGTILASALTPATVGAATITVVDGAVAAVDDAICSLVEAIDNANDTATGQPHNDCAAGNPSGADTINLPAGGNFLLTTPVGATSFDSNGLPVITGTVIINGNGSTLSRASTAPAFRIMAVEAGGDLTVNNAAISGGLAPGSFGFGGGGGFIVKGRLTLNGATVSGNSGNDGGGIFNYEGTLTINNSTLSNNYASHFDSLYWRGGGAINNWGAMTITNSVLSGNRALGEGGAIHNYYPGEMDVRDTTFTNNEASSGGAVANGTGAIAGITRGTLAGNTADGAGGGIWNNGELTIRESTLTDNHALGGGGITNWSRLHGINITLSGNTAIRSGGGLSNSSASYIYNATMIGNSAGWDGGGAYNATNSYLSLQQTLVSGNTAVEDGDEVFHTPSVYGIIDDAYSVLGHSGAAGVYGFTPNATDVIPTEALALILDPALASNGGPTQTHALVAGGPAVDVAPDWNCSAGTQPDGIDQRGLPRNINGKGADINEECDAGAYEVQSGPPPPPSASLYVSPAKTGVAGTLSVTPFDILYRNGATNTWVMHFNGGDVGISKAISAFARLPGGDLLLVFKANQPTPAGTFTPWDVARFTPTSLGSTTAGTFSWYIDGSDVGLTTSGEKIDALDVLADGRVLVSTTGSASVGKQGGGTLKAQDEDVIMLQHTALGETTAGLWSLHFDGTAVPGLKGEDVAGFHADEATGDLYLGITGGFNVGGVGGNGKDVIKLTPSGGGYTVTMYWRGPDNGFNLNIGGLELE